MKYKAAGIEFDDKEFAKMKYNPFCDILKTYPHLTRYAEFKTEFETIEPKMESNKVIGYIFLMYDKNSPLHARFTDLLLKKKAAAELVKLKLNLIQLDNIFQLTLQGITDLITRFFELLHEIEFEQYLTLLESYQQLLAMIREPITATDVEKKLKAFKVRGELEQQSMVAKARLLEVRNEIFKEDILIEKAVVENKKKAKIGSAESYMSL